MATQQRQPQQKRPEQPMPTLRSNPPVVINGSMAGFLPGLRLQPVMLPLPRPAYSYYEKTLALHGISAPLANSYNPFSFVMRAPASRQQTDLTSSRSPNAQGHPQSIESRSNRGGRRVTAGTNHQDSGRKPQGQRRANGSVGGRPRKSSTPAKSFDLQSTAFPPLSTTSLENSAGEKAEIPPACWNGKSSSAASATSSTKRLSSDMDQNLSFLEVQMEKMNTSGEAEEIVKKASVPEPTAKMSYAKITQKTVAAPTECGKHRE